MSKNPNPNQMKITEIIFTSFIIKKVCFLSSFKTNDLANHININIFNSIQFILRSSDPGGVFRPRGYRTCQLGYINIYTKEATH